MTVIPSWLRSAGQAANLVSGRAELWLPGAIAALAYLGWLPLVLAVSPFPRTSDLVFLGTGLVSSSIFPLNVLMIGAVMTLDFFGLQGLTKFYREFVANATRNPTGSTR